MWEDVVVKEVREARLELEKEANHDLSTLYQRALETQSDLKTKLVSKPLPQLAVVMSGRA